MARPSNPKGVYGRSHISSKKDKDGRYHGYISCGSDPVTGKRIRKHVVGRTRKEVIDKVRDVEDARDEGRLGVFSEINTVGEWLTSWLITQQNIRAPSTAAKSEWAVQRWLLPTFGRMPLDRLTAELIERHFSMLRAADGTMASLKTREEVLTKFKTALNAAVARKHLTHNPATTVRIEEPFEEEIEPPSPDEVHRVLEVLDRRRDRARWLISLSTGLRQSEVLGLQWREIDLGNGVVSVRRQYSRRFYRHGCATPCGKRSSQCPRRKLQPRIRNLKTDGSRRTVPIHQEVIDELQRHRARQNGWRLALGSWPKEDWVFTTKDGSPLDHRADARVFKRICDLSEVPPYRIHDLRHYAATTLLNGGVGERVIQDLFGWSTTRMLARYTKVMDSTRRAAATTIGSALFGNDQGPTPTPPTPPLREKGDEPDAGTHLSVV